MHAATKDKIKKAKRLIADGMGKTEAIEKVGLSSATFYRNEKDVITRRRKTHKEVKSSKSTERDVLIRAAHKALESGYDDIAKYLLSEAVDDN